MKDGTTANAAVMPGCPIWCTTEHDNEEQEQREALLGRYEHAAGVSGFWQPEIRASGAVVLRERGSLVDVGLEMSMPFDGSGAGAAELVRVSTLDGLSLALTAPESRSLAAMLAAAADRLEGLG